MYKRIFMLSLFAFRSQTAKCLINNKNRLFSSSRYNYPESLSFSRRLLSTENIDTVNFQDVEKNTISQNAVLIDVREPIELVEDGAFPRSVNIPLGEIEQSLRDLSDEQFFKKYGHAKPLKSTPIIFACRKGSRSAKAQTFAKGLGYENVKNYSGGWMDWAEKKGIKV